MHKNEIKPTISRRVVWKQHSASFSQSVNAFIIVHLEKNKFWQAEWRYAPHKSEIVIPYKLRLLSFHSGPNEWNNTFFFEKVRTIASNSDHCEGLSHQEVIVGILITVRNHYFPQGSSSSTEIFRNIVPNIPGSTITNEDCEFLHLMNG